MQLSSLDMAIIGLYFALVVAVGLYFSRRAGRGLDEFFVSGRSLPWWLLGTSMVATTFSTDTPNLVSDIVRNGGVSGNWVWWAFVITGMCTVFFYAKLWRRSEALTDIGFYELRYSGRPAAFLRGFRALYLGVFFNMVIMASVTLAAIKIGGVLLGLDPVTVVIVCAAVTALYSASAGLWGVVVTDLMLFVMAMAGSLAAAYYALQRPEVGGLSGLVSSPQLAGKLSLLPDFSDWEGALAVFIIPLAVQWWSTWYPGAEPGGGGYVAQRMLAARDERHSMLSVLWFNAAHYGLRPWPWIIVALCSLLVFPTLDSIQQAFPGLDPSIIGHDLAYPAMLTFLPSGLLGLALASLAAAYMSTISTHLNWGSSYIVDDFYRRFVRPEAEERHYVAAARISTVLLTVAASVLALWLENALQAFQILLQIGAGTGLIFLLRWFWWRINAWSEISAMAVSFLVALYFEFVHEALGFELPSPWLRLIIGVALTTVCWLTITLFTAPADRATLQSFYDKIEPHGRGWSKAVDTSRAKHRDSPAAALACWFLSCAAVYAVLFGSGYFIYGRYLGGTLLLALALLCGWGILRLFPAALGNGSRRSAGG
ncbi:MAG TPA: sodium:solute symporter family protein [Acidobacteriota bacterium]|nr:sodium:solute symporter family protein [Acidobacteriota bacterium]